ncbi:tetratricopeptide repeat protein [Patescibacteria group bacterium]
MLKKIYKKDYFIVIVLILLTFATYAMSLKGNFLQMDDVAGVVNNDYVNVFSKALQSRSIKNIVNAGIKHFYGNNSTSFHFASIFIHFINAVLVFYILKNIFNKKMALISTLLFIVHPANSEAVSWISGSVYLYQAMFWLLSIYFYLLFRKKESKAALFVSYVALFIYVYTLQSAWVIVFPFLITVLDYFVILKKNEWRKYLTLIPYYLAMVYYLIFNFSNAINIRTADLQYYYVGTTSQNRLVSILRVIQNSFSLYLLPIKLNIVFSTYNMTAISALALFSFAGLLGYILYYYYKKDKISFALLLCVYVSILPLFSPISIGLGYAERYLYFGTIFFSIFITRLILKLDAKNKNKKIALIVFSILIPLFMFRTVVRTLDWKNDKTLWTAAQQTAPNNYEVYNELGNIYSKEEKLIEALEYYQKALDIRPQYPEVLHNAGLVYIKAGQLDNARAMFLSSLKLNPTLYESFYRLGQLEAFSGNKEHATALFIECLKIKPDYSPAQEELAKLR